MDLCPWYVLEHLDNRRDVADWTQSEIFPRVFTKCKGRVGYVMCCHVCPL